MSRRIAIRNPGAHPGKYPIALSARPSTRRLDPLPVHHHAARPCGYQLPDRHRLPGVHDMSFLRTAALILLAAMAPLLAAEGIQLFNGKDLSGWEGREGLWTVEDGAIVGQTTKDNPTKGNTFLFWRGQEIEDGELVFKCRLVETKNNSGVMFRGKDTGNFVSKGYQIDIQSGAEHYGKLYDEGGRGRVCMCGEQVVWDKLTEGKDAGKYGKAKATPIDGDAWKKAEKKDDWNEIRVVGKGNHIETFLNGVKVLDFTDNEEEKRSKKGFIALQIHAGAPMRIEFKDLVFTPAK
jgi:hypothetical protein